MEWFVTIFIFFGVIVVTALLFGGWLIYTIIRLIFRGFGALIGGGMSDDPAPPRLQGGQGLRCSNARCRNFNPNTAQFCRRCGAALPAIHRVEVRRAAMW
jgi:hypothetical protein